MNSSINSSSLDDMPEEISLHILSFLNTRDLQAISCTCTQFNRLVEDQQIWKTKTLSEFGEIVALGAKQYGKSWQTTYNELTSSKEMRVQNASKILQKHVQKIDTDDVQHRITVAASRLFGFGAPDPSTHYYPTGQTGSLGNHKITVFRNSYQ